MRRVDFEEYLEYARSRREVVIGDARIPLEPIKVERLNPLPEELTNVSTTVWSFPERGSWATHRGDYRGNWAPQIPRALILMYTEPGETVLDPMIGSGTTCIEAVLLGRNCIGVDINYDAVILTLHRLYWLRKALESFKERVLGGNEAIEQALKARVEIYHGDARKLDKIPGDSVDLVATHPPYYNIIPYGTGTSGDLSSASSLEEYLRMLREVFKEVYRVLKPSKYFAVLLGDTRIHKHYVPITHYALWVLLETGFILKEEVVKIQHKMKTTRELWQRLRNRDFLLIYHEKLYIARKPGNPEELKKYRYSTLLGSSQEVA